MPIRHPSEPRARRSDRPAPSALPPFDNPGALEAFVHRPANLRPGAGLVVVLHGCTQAGPSFARDAGWIDLADREGFVVLAPSQTRANNPNLCFNWYEPACAGENGTEVRSILAMIEAAIETHGLDRRRVYVTGLSAGGAMAFALVCHHPQVFAGAGIIAGLPADQARSLQEALALMKGRLASRRAPASSVSLSRSQAPTVSVWHGDADRIVVPGNAAAIAGQWIERTGLPEASTRTERSGGVTKSVWCHADGAVALEVRRMAGFGHALPLDVGGPDGLGRAAPHMVDCGLSSTRELARGWGLATDGVTASIRVEDWVPAPASETHAPAGGPHGAFQGHDGRSGAADNPVGSLREDIVSGLSPHVPAGVRDLIDRSLRNAGL